MKKFAQTDFERVGLTAEFYVDWAMTSLEKMSLDPYSNRGREFYEVIRQLEVLMGQIKDLEKKHVHAMTSISLN